MRHRSRPLAALILGAATTLLQGAATSAPHVSVTVIGVRSSKGQVLGCLTARPAAFPNCRADPAAIKRIAHAQSPLQLDFGPVAPGVYAISLLHDENRNGRADRALMVPREGFGFSRDAAVRMGPPSFAAAAFEVADRPVEQTIRMRYLF